MSINERIKFIRKKEKLTQAQFADKLGVTQPSLSDIESGKTKNIDDRNIKLICMEFNVNENWLKTGEGQMFSPANLNLLELLGEHINNLSDVEKKAVMEFIKLPEKHRKIIMDFIKSI